MSGERENELSIDILFLNTDGLVLFFFFFPLFSFFFDQSIVFNLNSFYYVVYFTSLILSLSSKFCNFLCLLISHLFLSLDLSSSLLWYSRHAISPSHHHAITPLPLLKLAVTQLPRLWSSSPSRCRLTFATACRHFTFATARLHFSQWRGWKSKML